ncbi:MAG: helix-turn-helix transcriptional regulator [Parvibaculum sp.]|uniref:helix-turn-helix transcriptional regulator n=1 Tax=Parvibaculum sp. TaxID=2024848 RepID=UPI00284E6A9D|nr:helix-turn-helix transcriptional regulator [Parvibaculum sp.]MDR3499520.1 helix-turn-helix transcriptional regulator [Parvibaculum sp.]
MNSIDFKGTLPLSLNASWSKHLAEALTESDVLESIRKLGKGLTALVPNTTLYAGFYLRDAPPIVIDLDGEHEWNRDYKEGQYLLDPSYEQFLKRRTSVCLSPKEMFPPDFRESAYYISYYRPYGMIDEICYLLYFDDNFAAYFSLMRFAGAPQFNVTDFRRLAALTECVEVAARRIWALYNEQKHPDPAPSHQLHRLFSTAYERFGEEELSDREKEVTHLLLKGLPPKSVGRMLKIAPGTVRNHIKRIYVKLDVRSQAELLALFFETLEEAAARRTTA